MRASSRRALLALALLAPLCTLAAEEVPGASVALRWTRVTDAVAYELEIARDPRFTDVVLRERVALNGYRWSSLPTQIFHWRVRSVDSVGRRGDWSQPRTIQPYADPTPPAQETPLPAAVPTGPDSDASFPWSDPPPQVPLSWDRVPGATAYQLRVVPPPGEEQSLSTSRTSLSFTPSGAGSWSWRVRGVNPSGAGAWSQPRRFLVSLAAPRITAPEPDAVLTFRQPQGEVEVRWEGVLGAGAYVVQLARDADFTSLASSLRLEQKESCLFTGISEGSYFLRVLVEGEDGNVASASAAQPLQLALAPPLAAPQPLLPEPGAVVPLDRGLLLRWTPVPGAAAYQLRIEPPDDAPPLLSRTTATELSVDPPKEGAFAWRVRALDAFEGPGEWSERRRMYLGLPPTRRAEIQTAASSLVADGRASTVVSIRLFDAQGRPIRGAHPQLSVTSGTITPARAEEGFYAATFTAPASAPSSRQAWILVRERTFESTAQLALTPPQGMLRAGADLGWNATLGTLNSPYLGLLLEGRLPVLGYRLGLGLRAGGYFGGRQLQTLAGPLEAQAQVGRASLLISYDHPLPWLTLYGAAGPSLQLLRVSVGQLVTGGAVPGLQLLLGALRQWGPGEATLELSYTLGEFADPDVRLRTGGLTATLGYRVRLP
ncbi:MAG: hypothetical protein M3Y59_25990 [Myxococcota bacterium]|nr:hypothetical protein [Myxococcota bacterium]